ncbi:TetR family transcriptional regulator [Spongiactinospora rosea]|uniref:TetR family transcriptional regulator n=1 Tax=Spongiactinospora rosea TaxID=2248750 RepID=A0A366M1L8_9ACTN|nr:TetR/AcrR family transcriptional regulator [Spongiactinospora rosea]RBQ20075.1 TetR family transcriptional regulator [Spongiactinospora rosea]
MDHDAGDRRSPAKRRVILEAAARLFLSEGYARVSVDTIAAHAGVGKQTVYRHFGNKERLFLAVIAEARAAASDVPGGSPPMRPTGDPVADLQQVGERLLRVVLSPTVAALHRLTIAELTHHPELQQSWRETSSDTILEEAGRYLESAGAVGTLTVSDAARAARQFVLLVATEGRMRSLHGTQPLSDAEIREIARQSAELIVAAHRPAR